MDRNTDIKHYYIIFNSFGTIMIEDMKKTKQNEYKKDFSGFSEKNFEVQTENHK